MKLFLPPVIGCALFLSLAGCASRSDYASFATAGQAYAKASSSLIQASSEIDMDDKSEILLESRNERLEIIAGIKADKSLSDEAREKKIKENLAKLEKKYCSTQEGQLKRLRVQQKLIAHNKLLADYFEQLALLAGGSQPKDIGAELKNTADSLNNIGKQLRAEALTANTDAFKQLGEVGVDLAIRSVLREELLTQELLLQALARQMKNQVKDQLIRDEENNVIGPFLGDGKINRADWKKERKRILTASFTSEQLEAAAEAAKKLRKSFEALLENKLDFASIQRVAADAQALDGVLHGLERAFDYMAGRARPITEKP